MYQHAIVALRDGVLDRDSKDEEVQSNKIHYREGLLASNGGVVDPTNTGLNSLILEQDFHTFIRKNFACKQCDKPLPGEDNNFRLCWMCLQCLLRLFYKGL
jgi:hypothetical protein